MSERLTWQRGREPDSATQSKASSSKSDGKVEKVGFLYNQQEIDQEQYLTGKKVDKAFNDYLARENRNFEDSLNPHKNDGTVREFDFARKSVEDPLLLLKQKESEKFKQLKANPQKMARLQKLMKAYLGQDEEGENSDNESTRKSQKKSHDRSPRRRRSRSRSPKRKRRSRSRSKSKEKPTKEVKEGYGLINPKGKTTRDEKRDEKYESQFSKYKRVPHAYKRKKEHGFSNKMSAEEKARKLAEMSGNAVLHDAQRESRVKKGREKEAREDAQNEGNKNDHSFYRKMKMAATDKSLEERVKARTSSNQKTAAALDKNWTKR